jgi:hypothetical protein
MGFGKTETGVKEGRRNKDVCPKYPPLEYL